MKTFYSEICFSRSLHLEPLIQHFLYMALRLTLCLLPTLFTAVDNMRLSKTFSDKTTNFG